VIHHRQGLPRGVEPREDRAAVHPRLIIFNATLDWFELIRDPDLAHAAFAKLFEQLELPGDDGADDRDAAIGRAVRIDGERPFESRFRTVVGVQEGVEPPP
jgi:hypothetical protein